MVGDGQSAHLIFATATQRKTSPPPPIGIDFSGEDIRCEGAKLIAKSLDQMPSLAYINVHDNKIGPEGISELAKALRHTSRLVSLVISHNSVGNHGGTSIAQAFQHIPFLSTLDIRSCGITEIGAAIISSGIKWSAPNLTSLRAGRNNFSAVGAQRLAEALSNTTTLTDLDLSYVHMGNIGSGHVASLMTRLASLRHLDIRGNGIGPGGIEVVSAVVQRRAMTSLTSLKIGSNGIGPTGASHLARALICGSLPRLSELEVAHNLLGPTGAARLAGGLRGVTQLARLDAASNAIEEAGAARLAAVLRSLASLTAVDLRWRHAARARARRRRCVLTRGRARQGQRDPRGLLAETVRAGSRGSLLGGAVTHLLSRDAVAAR